MTDNWTYADQPSGLRLEGQTVRRGDQAVFQINAYWDVQFYAREALRRMYTSLGEHFHRTTTPPVCDACGGRHWPEATT